MGDSLDKIELVVPQPLKARVMLWTDVSYPDMEVLDKMQCIPDLESALCRVFTIDLLEPKRRVLLELYVQTMLFCRENKLNKEQTSALLSIIKSIHAANIDTPLNNIELCFAYCKELLLCHSIRRPPFSVNLFSYEEALCILNYIHNNYFSHYKLYKSVFTPQMKLDLSLTYSGVVDNRSSVMEDSFVPADANNVMEEETAPKTCGSSETQETSTAEQEEVPLGSSQT
ncbi:coiled-coil domain-containing protein 189 [Cololabis saira]|uniref:coiled-coil domain-containing protein 189 n=1 Tax=Cololabis saira TaxID=129043 RepID=UPI002AD2AC60|nr:coiled-coil domain-containing protein 189 [Cololabis saira]